MRPILLFVSNETALQLADGAAPQTALSENTHLFVIAQEALRLGWRIVFQAKNQDSCLELENLYPTVRIQRRFNFSDADFQPDMMFFINYPIDLAPYAQKNKCLISYILNAHFWLEMPEVHGIGMPEFWRDAFAGYVDFVVTQNPRMADIGYRLFNIIAGFPYEDRFLIAPNSFTPETLAAEHGKYERSAVRTQMQAKADDIVVVNSGGAWHWTDIEVFLEAFAIAIRQGAQRLKFFQIGIRQPVNEYQIPTEQKLRLFMAQHFDLIENGNLVVIDDWAEASKLLPAYNYGADVGLNISKESAENYQSHRVRFMDYAKAGLPVLQTGGSYFGDHAARGAIIPVQSVNVQSYVDALIQLHENKIDLGARRAEMHKFRDSIRSDQIIPDVLRHILATGPVPAEGRKAMQKDLRNHYQSDETRRYLSRPYLSAKD